MSAELEFINGEAAFAYSQSVKPWHGEGHEINWEASVQEAAKIAQLDNWNIQKVPVEVRLPPGGMAWNRVVVPNQYQLVRMMDQKVLTDQVVTDRYEVMQNEQIFDILDPLIERGIVQFETCGSLRGGKMVFALLRFRDCKDVHVSGFHKMDVLLPFLYVYTWHDGKGALHLAMTTVQVVCMNTHKVSIGEGLPSVEISHTLGAADRLAQASEGLLRLRELWLQYQHRIGQLEAFHFARNVWGVNEEVGLLVRKILGIKQDVKFMDLHIITRKRLSWIMKKFWFKGLYGSPGSAWRLFSAITDYTSHHQAIRGKSHFESCHIGSGAEINERAIRIISDYVLEKTTKKEENTPSSEF